MLESTVGREGKPNFDVSPTSYHSRKSKRQLGRIAGVILETGLSLTKLGKHPRLENDPSLYRLNSRQPNPSWNLRMNTIHHRKADFSMARRVNPFPGGLLLACWLGIGIVSGIVSGVGCTDTATPKSESVADDIQPPAVRGDRRPVELTTASWSDIQQTIAEQPGKIVVVDFWSTSCVPCKREFPNLVELQERYPERLVCIAVCMDYIGLPSKSVESYREKAQAFLDAQQPIFKCYLSNVPDTELSELADIKSLPTVKVYDSKGSLVATIDETNSGEDGFSYASDVEPLLGALIKGLDWVN
jgi:thiol-disulfide isomerase/thioredoxin